MSLTDKIFGREELKEKINFLEDKVESLEKEKRELKRKADKEEKRAKEAVSEKQDLDRKINKQKDRIESLEEDLKKKEFLEDTSAVSGNRSRELGREDVKGILNKLDSMESKDEDMFTVYLPKGSSVQDLDSQGLIQTNLTLNQLQRLKEEGSETGKALFHCENLLSFLIKPPVPLKEEDWVKDSFFDVGPLKKGLDKKVGFLFLSAGGSAAAVFSEEIGEFEILKSEIKGKHSKGGFSQGRFERGRKEELKKHVDDVLDSCEEIIPDGLPVALCGSEEMIGLLKDSGFLEDKEFFRTKMDMSSIETRGDLERAFHKFWKSDIIHL